MRIRIAICVALLAATVAAAETPKYTAIYAFGDSYLDVGNIYLATGGAKPVAPYFPGHFSNGPIWLEHISGALGLPILPSLAGGTDFAVGGAWVTAPQQVQGQTIPDVPQQVALYLSQHGGKADPHALYVIEGGGNDIIGSPAANPDTLGFQIALGIAGSELALRQAGARHFLLPNLFDVGRLPAAAANPAFATAASKATNYWVNVLLRFESFLPRVSITRLDAYSLLNAIETSPTHFGFLNVTSPCLTTSVCADPDHTLFWDSFHLSEFGQTAFAVLAQTALAGTEDH